MYEAMYEGASTAVKLRNGESEAFQVVVGVHQGFEPVALHYCLGGTVSTVQSGLALRVTVCR